MAGFHLSKTFNSASYDFAVTFLPQRRGGAKKDAKEMIITKENILQFEKLYRTNLFNSLSGFKSANLIGTISKEGKTNLAIFSSVIHVGANPPFNWII